MWLTCQLPTKFLLRMHQYRDKFDRSLVQLKIFVVIGILIVVTSEKGEAWRLVYRGCYHEGSRDDLNSSVISLPKLATAEFCADICHQAGFHIFGLKASSECFCEVTNGLYNTPARPDSECNLPCSGDNREVCGGSERYSVYELVEDSNVRVKHIGCYIDKPARVLNGMVDYSVASVDECFTFCYENGYSILGTEYRTQCFCGNSGYDQYGKVDENECSMRCTDGLPCGGTWRISIYLIKKEPEKHERSFIRTSHTQPYEVSLKMSSTSAGICALSCLSRKGCVGYSYDGISCIQLQPKCSSSANNISSIHVSEEFGVKQIAHDNSKLTTSSGHKSEITGSPLTPLFLDPSDYHWIAIDMNSIYSVCGLVVNIFGPVDLEYLSVKTAYHPELLNNGQTCHESTSLADYLPCDADARSLKIEFNLTDFESLNIQDIRVEGWKRENL